MNKFETFDGYSQVGADASGLDQEFYQEYEQQATQTQDEGEADDN